MTDTPAVESSESAAPVRKKPGLGITSLVLALLAVLGDVLVVVIGVASIRSFDDSVGGGLGLLAVFLGVGGIALIVGLALAALALLLAIIALATGRGRVPAVFGLLIALGTVIGHSIVLALISAAGSGIGSAITG